MNFKILEVPHFYEFSGQTFQPTFGSFKFYLFYQT